MGEIRPLGRLTVLYRGLPIGTVGLGEAHYDDAPTPPDSLAPFHRPPTDLVTTEFRPLPGYAAVADAIRSAGRAFNNYGFIGPAADPASDERGEAALAASAAVCEELEFRDEQGAAVPGRARWFVELEHAGSPHYWLDASFEEAPAGVLARLRGLRRGGGGHENPAA